MTFRLLFWTGTWLSQMRLDLFAWRIAPKPCLALKCMPLVGARRTKQPKPVILFVVSFSFRICFEYDYFVRFLIATTDLMQVSFTIKTKAKCGLSYEPTVQFCAGDDRLMKDTCYVSQAFQMHSVLFHSNLFGTFFLKGDSGGPLMTADENNQFIFTGIVSFGDQSCRGRGIYTNVSYYYDWIVNNSLY